MQSVIDLQMLKHILIGNHINVRNHSVLCLTISLGQISQVVLRIQHCLQPLIVFIASVTEQRLKIGFNIGLHLAIKGWKNMDLLYIWRSSQRKAQVKAGLKLRVHFESPD